jgi:hypothetical protein
MGEGFLQQLNPYIASCGFYDQIASQSGQVSDPTP